MFCYSVSIYFKNVHFYQWVEQDRFSQMRLSVRTTNSLGSPHLAFKTKWAMYKQVEKLNFLTFHLQSFISIKCLWKFPVVWAVSPPTDFLLSTYGAKTSQLRRATGPLTDSWSVTHVMCLCPSFLNARHRLPAWEIVAGEQQRNWNSGGRG